MSIFQKVDFFNILRLLFNLVSTIWNYLVYNFRKLDIIMGIIIRMRVSNFYQIWQVKGYLLFYINTWCTKSNVINRIAVNAIFFMYSMYRSICFRKSSFLLYLLNGHYFSYVSVVHVNKQVAMVLIKSMFRGFKA